MRCMLRMGGLAITFLSLLGLLAYRSNRLPEPSLNRPDVSPSGQNIVEVARNSACPVRQIDALRSFGCAFLAELVRKNNPVWINGWKTKEDICLVADSCEMPTPAHEADIKTLLFRSARLAVQLSPESSHMGGIGKANKRTETDSQPVLASVLFNDLAVSALPSKDAVLGLLNTGKSPKFPYGSVIAKAIWGTFPLGSDGQVNPSTHVFASAMQSKEQDAWSDVNPTPNFTLPTPAVPSSPQGTVEGGWAYPSLKSPTVDKECESTGHTLQWECLFAILLNRGDADSVPAKQVEKNVNDDLTVNTGCALKFPATARCQVALMGIHFMVRLKDRDDPLRRGVDPYRIGSPWLFITYWWTGKDNGMGLKAPWKYYQMNITQDFRDDSAGAAVRHVCFNPYLEGFNKNGTRANCVNCHFYAAYNVGATNPPLISLGTGTDLGARLSQLTTSPSSRPACATNADYGPTQTGVVCTDFVWSLASLNGAPHK